VVAEMLFLFGAHPYGEISSEYMIRFCEECEQGVWKIIMRVVYRSLISEVGTLLSGLR